MPDKVTQTEYTVKVHLSSAVLIEIRELERQGGITEWHIEEAQRRLSGIMQNAKGAGGEELFIKLPGTAQSMATLTECLAVLAFILGGVDFAELHFEGYPAYEGEHSEN